MPDLLRCPNCQAPLLQSQADHQTFWVCTSCGGRAATIELLRRIVSASLLNRLWGAALQGQGKPGRPCPSCAQPMAEVPTSPSPQALRLDICTRCHYFWFDPLEYQEMPAQPPPAPEPELPRKARELLAIAEVEKIRERAEREEWGSGGGPDEGWKILPAIFGLPVEEGVPAPEHRPWVTWGLIASISAISIASFFNLREIVQQYGFIPADAWRLGGLTSLTSFSLHGGVWHLLGNMYFLFIFGDNVEDFLGHWRFLLLLLTATVLGDILHALIDTSSTIPSIGASGGISGVLLFYACQFPKARLGILLWWGWVYPQWFRVPVLVWMVLWIVLQFIGAAQEMSGIGAVAASAHLGGALAGILFWFATRARAATWEPRPVRSRWVQ